MSIHRRPWLMVLASMFFIASPAHGGSISIQILGGGTMKVIPDPSPYLAWTPGPGAQASYKYCWRISSQPQATCMTSHTSTQQISGFAPGVQYNILGFCFCRVSPTGPYAWRPLGQELQFTYPLGPATQSTLVRIRNVLTSQCAYVEANSHAAKHWVCWPDPNMRFYRDNYADGTSRFRDVVSGKCLWGGLPNQPGVATRYCGALGTHFRVLPAGGGQVRLFVPTTGLPPILSGYGGCLYADGGNGGAMLKETCGGSQRSLFVLDPA